MGIEMVMHRLTDGGTYTFQQLHAIGGKSLANRARQLAGVPIPAPTPKVVALAPKQRARRQAKAKVVTGVVPARAPRQAGRLGDRLARG